MMPKKYSVIMPQTKNQLIRYLALDKCLRDTRRRYFMPDLVAACQKALLEYDGSTVEERTVRKDLQDMKRDSLYAAPINKYMDGILLGIVTRILISQSVICQ